MPSLGGTLYGLMYPLHFGHFAGVLSQGGLVRAGRGACASSSLSGFRLWVRRRADDPQWRAFGRVVQVTGYGLPLAMLVGGLGLLPVAAGGGRLLVDAGELSRSARRLRGAGGAGDDGGGAAGPGLISGSSGLACLGLPVLRLAMGGMDWAEAVLLGQHDVLTVDLLLIIAGAWLWL